MAIKFIRYKNEECGQSFYGVYRGATINEIEGDIFSTWHYTGKSYPIEQIRILSPIVPNQMIGIGKNYFKDIHEKERVSNENKDPVLFFKSTSSIVASGEKIVIPKGLDTIKFEAELAIIIGKTAKDIEKHEVLNHIFGYTVINDITAPQYFHEDGHWFTGKSYDTFLPMGPVIETELNPFHVNIKSKVDGAVKQSSMTNLMITPVDQLVSYISKILTLKVGDVILTGTPNGSEYVGAGSTIQCEVEGIGYIRNKVIRKDAG